MNEPRSRADEDHEFFRSLAKRLQLDEKEADGFVRSSMRRLGYRERIAYEEPEDEGQGSGDGGDFFSGRRQERERRSASGGSGNSSGWQYGQ